MTQQFKGDGWPLSIGVLWLSVKLEKSIYSSCNNRASLLAIPKNLERSHCLGSEMYGTGTNGREMGASFSMVGQTGRAKMLSLRYIVETIRSLVRNIGRSFENGCASSHRYW
jgi:hypothetical protein